MFADPLLIAVLVLAAAVLLLAIWAVRLELRLRRLLRGKKARDLEDTIIHLGERIVQFAMAHKETRAYLEALDRRIRKSLNGFATVRFNPFKDQGGNQSFATALLNEDGDGVVLSSLYGRDKVGIYAKPVTSHTSEHELSAEEKEAIEKARTTHE